MYIYIYIYTRTHAHTHAHMHAPTHTVCQKVRRILFRQFDRYVLLIILDFMSVTITQLISENVLNPTIMLSLQLNALPTPPGSISDA